MEGKNKNKNKTYNIVFIDKSNLVLGDLIEKILIKKDWDLELVFYYGFVLNGEFYLTEEILKILSSMNVFEKFKK